MSLLFCSGAVFKPEWTSVPMIYFIFLGFSENEVLSFENELVIFEQFVHER